MFQMTSEAGRDLTGRSKGSSGDFKKVLKSFQVKRNNVQNQKSDFVDEEKMEKLEGEFQEILDVLEEMEEEIEVGCPSFLEQFIEFINLPEELFTDGVLAEEFSEMNIEGELEIDSKMGIEKMDIICLISLNMISEEKQAEVIEKLPVEDRQKLFSLIQGLSSEENFQSEKIIFDEEDSELAESLLKEEDSKKNLFFSKMIGKLEELKSYIEDHPENNGDMETAEVLKESVLVKIADLLSLDSIDVLGQSDINEGNIYFSNGDEEITELIVEVLKNGDNDSEFSQNVMLNKDGDSFNRSMFLNRNNSFRTEGEVKKFTDIVGEEVNNIEISSVESDEVIGDYTGQNEYNNLNLNKGRIDYFSQIMGLDIKDDFESMEGDVQKNRAYYLVDRVMENLEVKKSKNHFSKAAQRSEGNDLEKIISLVLESTEKLEEELLKESKGIDEIEQGILVDGEEENIVFGEREEKANEVINDILQAEGFDEVKGDINKEILRDIVKLNFLQKQKNSSDLVEILKVWEDNNNIDSLDFEKIREMFEILHEGDLEASEKDLDISGTQQKRTNDFSGLDNLNSGDFAVENFANNSGRVEGAVGNQETNVMEQVFTEINDNLHSETDRLQIQLEPESLGKVDLDLSFQNGTIEARIMVENKEVRNHLEQNVQGLRNALSQQGFEFERLEIDIDNHSYDAGGYSDPEMDYQDGRQQNSSQQNLYQDEYYDDMEEGTFTYLNYSSHELPGLHLQPQNWFMSAQRFYRGMNISALG